MLNTACPSPSYRLQWTKDVPNIGWMHLPHLLVCIGHKCQSEVLKFILMLLVTCEQTPHYDDVGHVLLFTFKPWRARNGANSHIAAQTAATCPPIRSFVFQVTPPSNFLADSHKLFHVCLVVRSCILYKLLQKHCKLRSHHDPP